MINNLQWQKLAMLGNSLGYKTQFILFSKKYRKPLSPTQPPMKWIPTSFPVEKWPGREDEHWALSSAEVKNE